MCTYVKYVSERVRQLMGACPAFSVLPLPPPLPPPPSWSLALASTPHSSTSLLYLHCEMP